MRVGASTRQYHQIKRMHAEGVPDQVIANTIQMTPQSLEKILAHMDGREEKILAVEENAEVQSLRLANAELAAKLAKFEDPQDGEKIQHGEAEEVKAEETVEGGAEVAEGEEVATDEVT